MKWLRKYIFTKIWAEIGCPDTEWWCPGDRCLITGAIAFTGLIRIMLPTAQAMQEKALCGLAYREIYKWRGKEETNPGWLGEAKRKNKSITLFPPSSGIFLCWLPFLCTVFSLTIFLRSFWWLLDHTLLINIPSWIWYLPAVIQSHLSFPLHKLLSGTRDAALPMALCLNPCPSAYWCCSLGWALGGQGACPLYQTVLGMCYILYTCWIKLNLI